MRSLRTAVLAALLLLLFAATAIAAPRYTEPGKNGPEPCTEAAPCSIKRAIEDAPTNGTEVVVKPGTYSISSTILVDRKLNIHGVDGQARPKLVPAQGFNSQTLFLAGTGMGENRIDHI